MDKTKVTEKSGGRNIKKPTGNLGGTKKHKPEKSKKEKRKWRNWQKVLLWIFIGIILFAIGVISAFFVQRGVTKHQLKTEEQYITYNEKEYRYRPGIVNILLLGIDKNIPLDEQEERRDNLGMSDAIMLVSLDTERHEVKVIAIPRDSVAELQTLTEDGERGPMEKSRICRQYAAGRNPEECNQLTKEAVSRLLYNVPIQRCCAINDNVLPTLNDAIGGVDVVVQEDLTNWEERFVEGATVHLEAELAYRYVNLRNTGRVDGTLLRTQRQKQYVKAFAEQAKSVAVNNPSIMFALLKELQELQRNRDMCMDVTVADVMYLLPELLKVSFSDEMIQVLPGESEMGEEQHANYFLDSNGVIDIVIDTFYEEV